MPPPARRTLLANHAGRPRVVTAAGRRYLVAPLVMLVPGVLSGGHGPLYYPPDEVAASVPAWDGVPITVGHPLHPLTGAPVTADSPGALARQGVGHVRRPRLSAGRLVADGWFDADRLARVSPGLLSALSAGRPVEVSTGLFTLNDPSPGRGPDGRRYDAVARRHRPDHLAVLPHEVGACSLADGCGANRR